MGENTRGTKNNFQYAKDKRESKKSFKIKDNEENLQKTKNNEENLSEIKKNA
jgi:hypothetical protein